MNKDNLFEFILEDEYWLKEAIEHFLLTASEERIDCLKESYND